MVVYANILLSEKSITRNLVKCDYIFHQPLLEITKEPSTTRGMTSTHEHHISVALVEQQSVVPFNGQKEVDHIAEEVLRSGDDDSRSHKRSRTEEESAA